MCQQLYDYDAKLQLVPVLAAALPVLSKDKLSYTIQLRKGIQFNDGTPFNAQAVVTTVQRFMTYPGSVARQRLRVRRQRHRVRAVHGRLPPEGAGLDVHRRQPVRPLADAAGQARRQLRDATRSASARSCSTTASPATTSRVIKSPYYYDQKDVYLDKIVFKPMPDAAAAAAALKAGDIQVLDSGLDDGARRRPADLEPAGDPGATSSAGRASSSTSATRTASATCRTRTWARRSRRARSCGRRSRRRSTATTLNKVVFGGLYQPSCTPSRRRTPPGTTRRRSRARPTTPKHAKKLVAASGFPNPTVHLLTTNTTDRLRLAQFIQAQEAAVGINVVIDSTDSRDGQRRGRRAGTSTRCSAASSGRPRPQRATSTSSSRPRGRGTTAATPTRGST